MEFAGQGDFQQNDMNRNNYQQIESDQIFIRKEDRTSQDNEVLVKDSNSKESKALNQSPNSSLNSNSQQNINPLFDNYMNAMVDNYDAQQRSALQQQHKQLKQELQNQNSIKYQDLQQNFLQTSIEQQNNNNNNNYQNSIDTKQYQSMNDQGQQIVEESVSFAPEWAKVLDSFSQKSYYWNKYSNDVVWNLQDYINNDQESPEITRELSSTDLQTERSSSDLGTEYMSVDGSISFDYPSDSQDDQQNLMVQQDNANHQLQHHKSSNQQDMQQNDIQQGTKSDNDNSDDDNSYVGIFFSVFPNKEARSVSRNFIFSQTMNTWVSHEQFLEPNGNHQNTNKIGVQGTDSQGHLLDRSFSEASQFTYQQDTKSHQSKSQATTPQEQNQDVANPQIRKQVTYNDNIIQQDYSQMEGNNLKVNLYTPEYHHNETTQIVPRDYQIPLHNQQQHKYQTRQYNKNTQNMQPYIPEAPNLETSGKLSKDQDTQTTLNSELHLQHDRFNKRGKSESSTQTFFNYDYKHAKGSLDESICTQTQSEETLESSNSSTLQNSQKSASSFDELDEIAREFMFAEDSSKSQIDTNPITQPQTLVQQDNYNHEQDRSQQNAMERQKQDSDKNKSFKQEPKSGELDKIASQSMDTDNDKLIQNDPYELQKQLDTHTQDNAFQNKSHYQNAQSGEKDVSGQEAIHVQHQSDQNLNNQNKNKHKNKKQVYKSHVDGADRNTPQDKNINLFQGADIQAERNQIETFQQPDQNQDINRRYHENQQVEDELDILAQDFENDSLLQNQNLEYQAYNQGQNQMKGEQDNGLESQKHIEYQIAENKQKQNQDLQTNQQLQKAGSEQPLTGSHEQLSPDKNKDKKAISLEEQGNTKASQIVGDYNSDLEEGELPESSRSTSTLNKKSKSRDSKSRGTSTHSGLKIKNDKIKKSQRNSRKHSNTRSFSYSGSSISGTQSSGSYNSQDRRRRSQKLRHKKRKGHSQSRSSSNLTESVNDIKSVSNSSYDSEHLNTSDLKQMANSKRQNLKNNNKATSDRNDARGRGINDIYETEYTQINQGQQYAPLGELKSKSLYDPLKDVQNETCKEFVQDKEADSMSQLDSQLIAQLNGARELYSWAESILDQYKVQSILQPSVLKIQNAFSQLQCRIDDIDHMLKTGDKNLQQEFIEYLFSKIGDLHQNMLGAYNELIQSSQPKAKSRKKAKSPQTQYQNTSNQAEKILQSSAQIELIDQGSEQQHNQMQQKTNVENEIQNQEKMDHRTISQPFIRNETQQDHKQSGVQENTLPNQNPQQVVDGNLQQGHTIQQKDQNTKSKAMASGLRQSQKTKKLMQQWKQVQQKTQEEEQALRERKRLKKQRRQEQKLSEQYQQLGEQAQTFVDQHELLP